MFHSPLHTFFFHVSPVETWLSSSQTGLDRLSRAQDAALCRSRPSANSHYQIHPFEDFSLKADKSCCHGQFTWAVSHLRTYRVMEDFELGSGAREWVSSRTIFAFSLSRWTRTFCTIESRFVICDNFACSLNPTQGFSVSFWLSSRLMQSSPCLGHLLDERKFNVLYFVDPNEKQVFI